MGSTQVFVSSQPATKALLRGYLQTRQCLPSVCQSDTECLLCAGVSEQTGQEAPVPGPVFSLVAPPTVLPLLTHKPSWTSY